VRVELVRDTARPGVEVVFRPLLAPLLVKVEIAGDRVLSAGAARRAARLRPGEPLWPARLERAGRDVAIALSRRGHLEALVTAEAVRDPQGAVLVFRVHAGPRVRVSSIDLECNDAALRAQLAGLVRPRTRASPTSRRRPRPRATRCASAWPRAATGAPRSRSARPTIPRAGRMRLAFRAVPWPAHELRDARRAAAGAAREPGGPDPARGRGVGDSLEAGAELVETRPAGGGPSRRERQTSLETARRRRGGGLRRNRAGELATVGSVELRGADPALLAGLRTQPARPLEDAALTETRGSSAARLEALGHFEARVEAEVPDGGGVLSVVFDARPGPRARVAECAWRARRCRPAGTTRARGARAHEGQPYRLADVARSRETLVSPGAARDTWTCACAAT
jgi:hypothetical protein